MGFKPEAEVTYDKHERKLNVKVRNTGHERGTVTVRQNAYSNDGPTHVDVKPGDVATLHWSLERSGNWYDITVTTENFERRFAGRLEDGRPGVSDPAMALHLN
jgi:phospholipase C